jgi:hypothetical protein
MQQKPPYLQQLLLLMVALLGLAACQNANTLTTTFLVKRS